MQALSHFTKSLRGCEMGHLDPFLMLTLRPVYAWAGQMLEK